MPDDLDRLESDYSRSEIGDKYLSEYGEDYRKSRFQTNMRRDISWVGAFFVAAGVPALILFSMGGISAGTGPVAVLVWTLSVLVGFIDAFVYAEIAGLHPKKSGGTAVHGATAWIRYIRPAAPISLWCNWLAWTPVLALGSGLCAYYLLSVFPDALQGGRRRRRTRASADAQTYGRVRPRRRRAREWPAGGRLLARPRAAR